jgi:mycothiol synthase
MTLPAGYRLRPMEETELRAVAELFNAEAQVLIGEDVVPPDFVERWWRHPHVDPGRDMAAVEAPDGSLAAAFLLKLEPPMVEVWGTGGVAIAHQGRGIGGAILDEAERRARSRPTALRFQSATFGLPQLIPLFESRGLRLVRRFLAMTIRFDGQPEPPRPVAGIRVTGYDPSRDAGMAFQLTNAAFADHWGQSEWTPESWLEDTHGRDAFEPSLWRLAWAGDEPAGILVGVVEEHHPDLGHVSLLGVTPAHRRRGIGELLLRTAFGAFHARGLVGAELAVDAESETGAARLYERVGMLPRPRVAIYEKELRSGPAGTV